MKVKKNLLKIICGVLCVIVGAVWATGIAVVVLLSGLFRNNLEGFFSRSLRQMQTS